MSDPPFRDVAGRPTERLDAAAWDARWAGGDTPWDMGGPAPPLVGALARGLVAPPGRALAVGCGAGHDARHVAAAGFDVTAIDIAPQALERARALTPPGTPRIAFVLADLFALPPELRDFDVVIEHTCFCAIDPGLRDAWVDAVADALRPGGLLLGLFFVFESETGPPFGATEEELRTRLGRRFEVLEGARPPDSHPARAARDFLVLARRR